MWVGISNIDGTPTFAFDQIMMVPAVKDCYKHFGVHGIYYAILFGWDGSPYRAKDDVKERDALAYMAVKDLEIFDPVKEKKMRATPKISSTGMYENVFIKQAIAAFNSFARMPQLEIRQYLFGQIDQLKTHQAKMKLDADDVNNFKRQMDTNKVITQSIRDMTAEIEKIDKSLTERFNIERYLSVNDLILLAK